ncbi:MAG: response regulator [Candidatus Omnitrophota bacterium]
MRAGFKVTMVHSGEDALEKLKEFMPDAILTDVRMPGMTGYEWVAEAVKKPGLEQVPIVFMSGDVGDQAVFNGAVEALAQQHHIDFLGKPFKIGDLAALFTELNANFQQSRRSEMRGKALETVEGAVPGKAFISPIKAGIPVSGTFLNPLSPGYVTSNYINSFSRSEMRSNDDVSMTDAEKEARHQEIVGDILRSPAFKNMRDRLNSAEQAAGLEAFLRSDSESLKQIFYQVDAMDIPAMQAELNEAWRSQELLIQGPIPVHQLFYHPSEGSEDWWQAIAGFKQTIDLAAMGLPIVGKRVRGIFMLMRLYAWMGRDPQVPLFTPEMAATDAGPLSLWAYLTSSHISHDGKLALSHGLRMLSYADFFIELLLDLDPRQDSVQVTEADLLRVWRLPGKEHVKEAIRNYLVLMKNLEDLSEPWRKVLQADGSNFYLVKSTQNTLARYRNNLEIMRRVSHSEAVLETSRSEMRMEEETRALEALRARLFEQDGKFLDKIQRMNLTGLRQSLARPYKPLFFFKNFNDLLAGLTTLRRKAETDRAGGLVKQIQSVKKIMDEIFIRFPLTTGPYQRRGLGKHQGALTSLHNALGNWSMGWYKPAPYRGGAHEDAILHNRAIQRYIRKEADAWIIGMMRFIEITLGYQTGFLELVKAFPGAVREWSLEPWKTPGDKKKSPEYIMSILKGWHKFGRSETGELVDLYPPERKRAGEDKIGSERRRQIFLFTEGLSFMTQAASELEPYQMKLLLSPARSQRSEVREKGTQAQVLKNPSYDFQSLQSKLHMQDRELLGWILRRDLNALQHHLEKPSSPNATLGRFERLLRMLRSLKGEAAAIQDNIEKLEHWIQAIKVEIDDIYEQFQKKPYRNSYAHQKVLQAFHDSLEVWAMGGYKAASFQGDMDQQAIREYIQKEADAWSVGFLRLIETTSGEHEEFSRAIEKFPKAVWEWSLEPWKTPGDKEKSPEYIMSILKGWHKFGRSETGELVDLYPPERKQAGEDKLGTDRRRQIFLFAEGLSFITRAAAELPFDPARPQRSELRGPTAAARDQLAVSNKTFTLDAPELPQDAVINAADAVETIFSVPGIAFYLPEQVSVTVEDRQVTLSRMEAAQGWVAGQMTQKVLTQAATSGISNERLVKVLEMLQTKLPAGVTLPSKTLLEGPQVHVYLKDLTENDRSALVTHFAVVLGALVSLRGRLLINIDTDSKTAQDIGEKIRALAKREGITLAPDQLKIVSSRHEDPFLLKGAQKVDALVARSSGSFDQVSYQQGIGSRWVTEDAGDMKTLAAALTTVLYAALDKQWETERFNIHRPSEYDHGALLATVLQAIQGYLQIRTAA